MISNNGDHELNPAMPMEAFKVTPVMIDTQCVYYRRLQSGFYGATWLLCGARNDHKRRLPQGTIIIIFLSARQLVLLCCVQTVLFADVHSFRRVLPGEEELDVQKKSSLLS